MNPLQKLNNGYTVLLSKESGNHFIVLAVSPDNKQVAVSLLHKDRECLCISYFTINGNFDIFQNPRMIDALKEYNERE